MSNFPSFSSMLQTSNIICQSVNLTDELKINLEYDIHRGLLNIFVKNNEIPCHINVLSKRSEERELTLKTNLSNLSHEKQQDLIEEISYQEPKICIELSTIYVYDILDEYENIDKIDLNQSMIASSSCFDEQSTDNDDGYSTHSHDDIEQQQQQQLIAISSSKLIVPSCFYQYYSEQYVSPVRRLIEQLTWLSPFKKMMMNHPF